MSQSINKVILIGRLGIDPTVKETKSGQFCTMSIATSQSWKDKSSGEWQEKTEWHRVVVFGQPANYAAEYLGKGNLVYVEGSLQTRKWQDKTGDDRYTTEIVARVLQRLEREPQVGVDDNARSQNPDQDIPF